MEEKSSSVKISTKAWHYKLMVYVLGNNAPTPENMHNLCPYFWLTIASLLLVTPVGIWSAIKFIFFKLDDWILIPIEKGMARLFLSSVSDKSYYRYTNLNFYGKEYQSITRHEKYLGENFMDKWFEGKHGFKIGSKEYNNWLANFAATLDQAKADSDEKQRNLEERIDRYHDGIKNVFSKASDSVASWKGIIKWTKRIVSVIISLILLTCTFWIVNLIGWGILSIVNVWTMESTFAMLEIIGTMVAFVIFVFVLHIIREYLKSADYDVWWVRLLKAFVGILFIPIKFIFYIFLWQIVIVGIAIFLKNLCIAIFDGVISFSGIFGSYFGAAKSDYCPGLEWEEENEAS